MIIDFVYLSIFFGLIGIPLGAGLLWGYQRYRLLDFKRVAAKVILQAESDAEECKRKGDEVLKKMQFQQQRDFETIWRQERHKLRLEEDRIKQREDKADRRMGMIEKKLFDIDKKEMTLSLQKEQFEEEKKKVAGYASQLQSQLERSAGLTAAEAKEQLLMQIAGEVKHDMANYIRRTVKEAKEESEIQARSIIATAINRLAVSCVSEATVNTVAIPNEEMKGRVIGREGRNVRALERATGINITIDDTPGAVVLSGFDPVRMQIAKMALSELIQDGRIHPTSIEEAVEKAKGNVQRLIKKHGEDAALRAGVINLHPELIMLLGKLKFRYSYGQNILEHSLEVSYLMGIMAAELGLDVHLAKRIGLLHDFGKAVSQEIDGSHAVIGHELALKYGELKEVANGIGCHHGEMEPITIEGSLCSAADAISASRQGARIESVNEYIKRLTQLEELAGAFPGVQKAYAMQAGRELQVLVLPDIIDDDGVINLARDLTKQIERDLRYPGKIKITVIREKRIVEYAM